MTSVNYMTYAPIGNFYTIYPGKVRRGAPYK